MAKRGKKRDELIGRFDYADLPVGDDPEAATIVAGALASPVTSRERLLAIGLGPEAAAALVASWNAVPHIGASAAQPVIPRPDVL